jgi:hypothetical protein
MYNTRTTKQFSYDNKPPKDSNVNNINIYNCIKRHWGNGTIKSSKHWGAGEHQYIESKPTNLT